MEALHYTLLHVSVFFIYLVNYLLHLAAGKLKTVRWLVNNDASGLLISAQDDNGDTPAHDAAGAG